MKRTLWTMATTGLLAACMTSCGGGKDYATSICDRLQSCKKLSLVSGATTVTECEKTANQQLSALSSSDRTTTEKALDQCLAIQDCPGFTGCMSTLINQGPSGVNPFSPTTDPVAAICNRLQACGNLSALGMTTVSECVATANQSLSSLSSTQHAAAIQSINQCLALSDCSSFASCVGVGAGTGPASCVGNCNCVCSGGCYVTGLLGGACTCNEACNRSGCGSSGTGTCS